jgi:hypothetical protein
VVHVGVEGVHGNFGGRGALEVVAAAVAAAAAGSARARPLKSRPALPHRHLTLAS